jgi:hypothetical protein
VWRRGNCVSAIARHPSAPNSLLSTTPKHTQLDLDMPFAEALLLPYRLHHLGHFLFSEVLVV